MSIAKNLTVAGLALAFAGHILWWMAEGRDQLEGRVAQTLKHELEHTLAAARANSAGCLPKHVVLETKTPDADALSPETLALLASDCEALGVEFHPEPPAYDLGCHEDRCGDCVGYAQQIRFNTPFVAAARTFYFRGDVFERAEGYWYVWWLGSWRQVAEPRYRSE